MCLAPIFRAHNETLREKFQNVFYHRQCFYVGCTVSFTISPPRFSVEIFQRTLKLLEGGGGGERNLKARAVDHANLLLTLRRSNAAALYMIFSMAFQVFYLSKFKRLGGKICSLDPI